MRYPTKSGLFVVAGLVGGSATADPVGATRITEPLVCAADQALVYAPTGEYDAARSTVCTA